MSLAQPPRTKRRTALRAVINALLVLIVVLTLAEFAFDLSFTEFKLGVIVVLLPLAALWIDALDEVARQANYWAWYWGCAVGISAMAILAVVVSQGAWHPSLDALLTSWRGAANAQNGFLLGLLTAPILCVLGFLCFWALYWVRNR